MMANGLKVSNKVLEFGRAKTEKAILENGIRVMFRVVEYTFGKMGTNTRESGRTHSNMVMELICLLMAIRFRACTVRGNPMVKVPTNGETELLILESSKMA